MDNTIKVFIIEEREIREENFWPWIHALRDTGTPIDGHKLLRTGACKMVRDRPYAQGTVTYLLGPTGATIQGLGEPIKDEEFISQFANFPELNQDVQQWLDDCAGKVAGALGWPPGSIRLSIRNRGPSLGKFLTDTKQAMDRFGTTDITQASILSALCGDGSTELSEYCAPGPADPAAAE